MSRQTRRKKAKRRRKGAVKPSSNRSKSSNRKTGLSPETVEKVERYVAIVLGAIEPTTQLIELIDHHVH